MIALLAGSTAMDITRPDATAGPIDRAFSPRTYRPERSRRRAAASTAPPRRTLIQQSSRAAWRHCKARAASARGVGEHRVPALLQDALPSLRVLGRGGLVGQAGVDQRDPRPVIDLLEDHGHVRGETVGGGGCPGEPEALGT